MNRAERRRLQREESCPLGWAAHPSPKQLKQGSGWFGELDHVYRKGNEYVVMTREVEGATHACIKSVYGTELSWSQKQMIKNEIFGPERVAVEVFPKESQLVDEADLYHLWVFPAWYELPFGLHEMEGKA